jgi:hypothetical protein
MKRAAMDDEGMEILRKLISDIEGAPYPGIIGNELYSIWYEHVQGSAQEALKFLTLSMENRRPPEDDREIP